jgi:hypothetical protein
MDFREIGWGGMDWIDLAQDRDWWRALVNTVMSLWVPQNFGKFLSGCATGGFSKRAQLHGVSYISFRSFNPENGLICPSISSDLCIISAIHPWSDWFSSRFVVTSAESKI